MKALTIISDHSPAAGTNGSIMNLLEIWADGSIQGYLSAKQTLRIIERVKARESPR